MPITGTGIPRATVPPPPTVAAAPYGLLSAATIGEGIDPHELNGVEYQTVCSTRVDGWTARCGTHSTTPDPALPPVKQHAETAGFTYGDPFALYAAETCLLGNPDPEGLDRLRTRFQLGEPAALENAFFTGKLGNRPSLQQGTSYTDSGGTQHGSTPVRIPAAANGDPMPRAIGKLEQWLATVTGGLGVIHAPRWTAETVATTQLLGTQGPHARTKMGTVLAFGTGYSGAAPAGAPAEAADDTHVWLYATPPVTIRRSTVLEPEPWGVGNTDLYGQPERAADDRTRPSDAGFRLLERTYVIDIPCGWVAAVRTDLDLLTLPQPTQEGAE